MRSPRMGSASFFFVVFLQSSVVRLFPAHFVEGRVVGVLGAAYHFEAVFVGVDGEVGLRLEDEDVAAFVVFGYALYAAEGDEYAALAVGVGEVFGADAVVDGFCGFAADEFGAVFEHDDGLGFALRGEAGDVEDGDVDGFVCQEADAAVCHGAVVPDLVDGDALGVEVAVGAVFEAVGVVAVAHEGSVVVVFDESAFEAAVEVSASDVAFGADAFPPAAVAVVVAPVGHLGSVALGGEDDVQAVFDAHAVFGLFDDASVGGEELPPSVAVALVVLSASEQVALFVVGFVCADSARHGVCVAQAHAAVVVVVGEGAGLLAVDEVAFEDFAAVLVGAHPVALATALFVNLVLRHGSDGSQQQCGGEEKDTFFHEYFFYYIFACL